MAASNLSCFGLVFAAVLLVQALFIGPSVAIKCYTCSACGDTVGNLISCSNEYSQCAEVRSQNLFTTQYDRYCVGQCPSYSGSAVQIKCCQTDACNGVESSTMASSLVSIFLIAAAVPFVRA